MKIKKLKKPHWQMKLKTWDGKDDIFQYDKKDISYWKMMINNSGDIYYFTHETPRRLNIYCGASQLHSHLLKLYRQGLKIVTKTA